jgi:hypothetical protein
VAIHGLNQYYYRWHSGILKHDYRQTFQNYLERYRRNPSIYDEHIVVEYDRAISPYISSTTPLSRDPLFLNKIPTDLWILCGFVGLLFVWRKSGKAASLFIGPIVIIYFSTLLGTVVGNIRYAYPLLPLYFFLTIFLLVEVYRNAAKYWRRKFLSKKLIKG